MIFKIALVNLLPHLLGGQWVDCTATYNRHVAVQLVYNMAWFEIKHFQKIVYFVIHLFSYFPVWIDLHDLRTLFITLLYRCSNRNVIALYRHSVASVHILTQGHHRPTKSNSEVISTDTGCQSARKYSHLGHAHSLVNVVFSNTNINFISNLGA